MKVNLQTQIDPITLEMLWRRLVSIVGELGSTLRRTSFSTVVRDIGDYGCAVFDNEARLLAQTPDSTPGLCGPLGSMLRAFLVAIPPETGASAARGLTRRPRGTIPRARSRGTRSPRRSDSR